MKVGDNLYCYSNKNGMSDIRSNFDIGQSYEVLSFSLYDNRVYLYTKNSNIFEWFNIIDNDEWYFVNFFYTNQDIRRIKLDKLKNCGHV